MEIKLSDEFLKETLETGFLMRIISDKKTTKVDIEKPYIMGYLAKANQ